MSILVDIEARLIERLALGMGQMVAEGLSMQLGLVRTINAGSPDAQPPSPMPRVMATTGRCWHPLLCPTWRV